MGVQGLILGPEVVEEWLQLKETILEELESLSQDQGNAIVINVK